MIPSDSFDILVVGAGPAGSCAALAAVRAGVRTLLVDAKPRMGGRPHCGEFVPRRLFQEFSFPRDCIVQSVDSMHTSIIDRLRTVDEGIAPPGLQSGPQPEQGAASRSGKVVETPSPGFMIDRSRFDRNLARDAAANGATVLCSTRLSGRERGAWILTSGREELRVRPRYVIAADGALSSVAAILGLERSEVLAGTQIEAPMPQPLDRTFVFLYRDIVGGYGWLFPKNQVANVGIGMVTGTPAQPQRVFRSFLEYLVDLGMIRPGRLARSSGVIPVSGMRDPLVCGTVVFCGDAAGLTHPITGAGIPQAVFSGHLAGSAVAAAVKSGEERRLKQYEEEIVGRYRGVLSHGLAKRRLMMTRWAEDDFQATCEQTWIAFPGYKKRVRGIMAP